MNSQKTNEKILEVKNLQAHFRTDAGIVKPDVELGVTKEIIFPCSFSKSYPVSVLYIFSSSLRTAIRL